MVSKLSAATGTIQLAPLDGKWDFTAYSLFSIRLTNDGPGTVWVEVRLANNDAQDWANTPYDDFRWLHRDEPRDWRADVRNPFEEARSVAR